MVKSIDYFSDNAHNMDMNSFRSAEIMLLSDDEQALFEAVLAAENILYYNGAWDFKRYFNLDSCVIRFKYNGTITANNCIRKLKLPHGVTISSHWS